MASKKKKVVIKAKQPVKKAKNKAVKTTPKSSAVSDGPLIPLGDRVIVRALTESEMGTTSPSGIIIPDTVSKEKPEQGIVVAVGKGKYTDGTLIPMTLKVGDRVVYSKYGFDEVKVGGVEYCVVSEGNVLAIIKE